jgi:hypothetical protein
MKNHEDKLPLFSLGDIHITERTEPEPTAHRACRPFRIINEADRASTTILLPDEY